MIDDEQASAVICVGVSSEYVGDWSSRIYWAVGVEMGQGGDCRALSMQRVDGKVCRVAGQRPRVGGGLVLRNFTMKSIHVGENGGIRNISY